LDSNEEENKLLNDEIDSLNNKVIEHERKDTYCNKIILKLTNENENLLKNVDLLVEKVNQVTEKNASLINSIRDLEYRVQLKATIEQELQNEHMQDNEIEIITAKTNKARYSVEGSNEKENSMFRDQTHYRLNELN
jgi:NCAIR mutase (PurE)-related protein